MAVNRHTANTPYRYIPLCPVCRVLPYIFVCTITFDLLKGQISVFPFTEVETEAWRDCDSLKRLCHS